MKIGIFALFCATLFLATQRAVKTPLAYFAFFPLGSLMVFYFYALRAWIFFSLSFALLAVSYFLKTLAPPVHQPTGQHPRYRTTFHHLFLS